MACVIIDHENLNAILFTFLNAGNFLIITSFVSLGCFYHESLP